LNLRNIIRESGSALRRNWIRSVLTILGISVGVGAFICVVAIGNAGSSSIENQLQSLGDNFIWIEAGSRARNGVRYGARGDRTLVLGDATAIVEQVPLIKTMSPNVDGQVQVIYEGENWATRFRGVTPGFLQIRRWNIYTGAHFAYRQASVTYHNDNLFFYDSNPPFEEHRFAIGVKQNFSMLQIPLGVMIPVYRKFYMDLAFSTNSVLSVKKTEKANDPGFAYQLVSLRRRDINQILFEASAGLAYQTSAYTAKLTYSRGLNPLQKKSHNCYNNLIPANLYFSAINLSMGVNMNRLFPFNRK